MRLLRILCDGLAREEKEGLINMWSKSEQDPDAKIPAEFSLKQSCNMEGITNCSTINLNKERIAIHITQIASNKLALFDKNVHLDDDDRQYIDELHLEKCIMLDDTTRKLHNFDEDSGGAENPHIVDHKTQEFREFIHGDCFVSNNVPGALWKYPTANNRRKSYGHGKGQFSYSCYGY
jgi:hypothetical protein